MGNGEKPADVNRDEDGSCLAGGAIRMDSESSSQGKRKADNHHVKLPAKKRRSQDEDNLILKSHRDGTFEVLKGSKDLSGRIGKDNEVIKCGNDLYKDAIKFVDHWDGPVEVIECGNDLYKDRLKLLDHWDGPVEVIECGNDLYKDRLKLLDHWDGPVEVIECGNDLYKDRLKLLDHWDGPVEVIECGNDLYKDRLKLLDHWDGPVEVIECGNDLYKDRLKLLDHWDGPVEVIECGNDLYGAGPSQVLKSGCDMDYTDESEMKCDSEGLNAARGSKEMARELISWGQSRKARCSGPFVVGSVKFKRIELGARGKQIPFDVGSIAVIHSDTPMFILVVEKRSVAEDFYHVLVRRGYPCIIVATMRKSLEGPTLEFVCKLQKMSNLQVYALFDCSPHFNKIMLDLTVRNGVDLIWLGIQPSDVRHLLKFVTHMEPGILTMTDTEQNLLAQYKDSLEAPSQYNCISEQLGLIIKNGKYNVPIKAFTADILIDYYLPKLLIHSGLSGAFQDVHGF